MDFGPDHYVPVLKVKRGEKDALRLLDATTCERITPLMEIVERKPNKRNPAKTATVDEHVNTAFKKLAQSVENFDRVFLDTREIAPDGRAASALVFGRAASEGIVFTPVTGLTRTVDVSPAMEHSRNGLALRLTRAEFESGGLPVLIQTFLATAKFEPEDIDLIVDLGAVDNMVAAGVMALTEQFLLDVPDHERWRTFTVSASAFPMGMGSVDRHSHALVERAEWIAWKEGLYLNRWNVPRLPTFSDCGIQHPKGVEGFDPVTMQVSAAVRYALPDDWLLIKGESTRQNPASAQFPILANRLVYGNLRSYYASAHHCKGCELMKNSADGAPKLGSAEVWRKLGTIHHLTTVTEQLSALSWI